MDIVTLHVNIHTISTLSSTLAQLNNCQAFKKIVL